MKYNKTFWSKKISERDIENLIRYDKKIKENGKIRYTTNQYHLPVEINDRIEEIANKSEVNFFLVFLTGFVALLNRLSRSEEIFLLSSAVSNENNNSYISNVLPILANVDGNMSFKQILVDVKSNYINANKFTGFSFDHILNTETNNDKYHPVYELGIIYDQIHRKEHLENNPCKILCNIKKIENKHIVEVKFAENLFSENKISILISSLFILLKQSLFDFDSPIKNFEIVDAEEKELVRKLGRKCVKSKNEIRQFIKEFKSVVDREPNKIALVHNGIKLTYNQLDKYSNTLANEIIRRSSTGNVVGAMFSSSVELIISVLAIIKTGRAFLPLDSEFPDERLKYILEDAGVLILLGSKHLLDKISTNCIKIPVDHTSLEQTNSFSLELCSLEEIIYVIYTSGSTGKPKGVKINNENLINYCNWFKTEFSINEQDSSVLVSSHAFDLGFTSIFPILLSGGTLHLVDKNMYQDAQKIIEYIIANDISYLKLTPSYFSVLIEEPLFVSNKLKSLRLLVLGGEAINKKAVQKFVVMYPHVKVINHYGPTETTIGCIFHEIVDEDFITENSISIGSPITNNEAYVLDDYNNLLPRGFAGELVISGKGVSEGYINDPELNTLKFLENTSVTDGRLYKTGDIAVQGYNGEFQFVGRKDHQVKIRGFRIEPGEIETHLRNHDKIKNAHIRITEINREYSIVAYIIYDNNVINQLEIINDLKDYLKVRIPEYMLPKHYIFLDEIPVTANNKVNNKALPLPKEKVKSKNCFEEPKTATQKRLVQIWEEILQCKNISINSTFFELGGHSVMMIKTISRIRKQFKAQVYLKDFFTHPTVKELSARIEELSKLNGSIAQDFDIRLKDLKDCYDISPVQYPEWFLQKLNPNSVFYNQTYVFELNGKLNFDAFKKSFLFLTQRHDVLRIMFKEMNGKPYQILSDNKSILKDDYIVDIRKLPNKEDILLELVKNEYYQIFKLLSSILFKIKLIQVEDKRNVLVFSTHHIVWDQLSSFTFFREFQICYNSYCKGAVVLLPMIRFNYIDYSEWLNSQISTGAFNKYKEFWINKFQEIPKPIDLGFGKERNSIQNFKGKRIYHQLSLEVKHKLESFCKEQGFTIQIYLLAVFNLLVYKLTGQKRFVVGTPTANRDDKSMEGIVGLFAAALPILCEVDDSFSFRDLLEHTRDESLQAYDNRWYPFNKIIEELNIDVDFSRSKIMSIFFGVQNDESELFEMELDGMDVKNFDMDYENYTTAFDITLQINHSTKYMLFSLRYDSDLLEESFANQILEHFVYILEQTLSALSKPIGHYQLVNNIDLTENYHLDLYSKIAPEKFIGYWSEFYLNIDKFAPNTAIRFKEESISYSVLLELSEKFSNMLISRGINKGDCIGVCFDPCPEIFPVLLGILRSGAVYVPMNKSYTNERIEEIAAEIDLKFTVTNTDDLDHIFPNRIIMVKSLNDIAMYPSIQIPSVQVKGNDLAYIIFTSGSTGKPKGIMIHYDGLMNILSSVQQTYSLNSNSVLLMNTPIVFDPSLLDMLWPLLYGGCVVIPDWNKKGIVELANCINKYNVDIFQCVPTFLDALCKAKETGEISGLNSLKNIIVGGDILTKMKYHYFKSQFSCKLNNHYGPTETTIDVAIFDCSQFDKKYRHLDIVPIGKPVRNTCLYILDQNMDILPTNVPGELYISSIGNATGYINGQNNERFVKNLFNDGISNRLYKSGDKALYCDDGSVVILGRIDDQVKIDGNRIELGEIENKLKDHPDIGNAAVLVDKELDKREKLVAFVEPDSRFNRVKCNNNYYHFFSLKDNPLLKYELDNLHSISWPQYFKGSDVLKNFWNELYAKYPEFQFALFNDNNDIIGIGNSVPVFWDGETENLPSGWDSVIKTAVEDDKECNTLVILAGVINPKFKGNNLGNMVIDVTAAIANERGFENLLVILRPIYKKGNQKLTIDQYIDRIHQKAIADKWVQAHLDKGGNIIKGEECSQLVTGTVEQWCEWSGQKILNEGKYTFPNTLSEVEVDLRENKGVYKEPGIWIDHKESLQAMRVPIFDKAKIWDYVNVKFQKYMIPHDILLLQHIPLLPSLKNDKSKLKISGLAKDRRERILPSNDIQHELFSIFSELLKTDDFGITDSFFQLGGQSINTLVLIARINNKFNVKMNIIDIYVHNSIRDLEKAIIKLNQQKANTKVIQLLKKGEKENVLLIASPFQKSTDFSRFVEGIQDKNVYLLQPLKIYQHVETSQNFNKTFEVLLNEIKKEIPETLNCVIAFSTAAIIAHELIYQLEQLDYDVSTFIVLDGKPSFSITKSGVKIETHEDFKLLELDELKNDYRIQLEWYLEFESSFVNKQKISCPICVLHNQFLKPNVFDGWNSLTKRGTLFLEGIGNHFELLSEKYAQQNIDLLLSPKKEIEENYVDYIAVIRTILDINSKPIPWVKQMVEKNRLLFLNFYGNDHRRYNSLEVSMIQDNKMEYIWLPGALSGGFGEVKPGNHNVAAKFFNDDKYTCLQLKKVNTNVIELSHAERDLLETNVEYLKLNTNSPQISFIPELEFAILHWLKSTLKENSNDLINLNEPLLTEHFEKLLEKCQQLGGEIAKISRLLKISLNQMN